jgi:hypothetical protein
MAREISAVLEYGAPEPGETATMMEDKLRFHTDSWGSVGRSQSDTPLATSPEPSASHIAR